MAKQHLAFRLTNELRAKLDEWAKEEKRSLSNLISLIIERAIEAREKEKK